MASVQEALQFDLSGYRPADESKPPVGHAFTQFEPQYNPVVRCPLPPVQITPDSLRQFYLGGQIPQLRLLTAPSNLTGGSAGGGSSTSTTIVNNSSSTTTTLKSTSASITTPALNPNQVYTGQMIVAKSFQLLSVSANSPARVELYGTAMAQTIDLGRGEDVAPAAGVIQNIISDVILDTAPLQWSYQNRIGANGDSPQLTIIYVTITNVDVISDTITVTLQFVPLES